MVELLKPVIAILIFAGKNFIFQETTLFSRKQLYFSFTRQVIFARPRSVDVDVAETARAGGGETGGDDHAGREFEQIKVIAPVDSEVLNLSIVDGSSLLARLGFDLELGGVGCHFNRGGDVADFKDRNASCCPAPPGGA